MEKPQREGLTRQVFLLALAFQFAIVVLVGWLGWLDIGAQLGFLYLVYLVNLGVAQFIWHRLTP